MDAKQTSEILDELIPTFQALDTQNTAVLQFLKDKGIANDEQLVPYLKAADSGSSVRWLAIRLRLERLLGSPEGDKKTRAPEQEGESDKADANDAGEKTADHRAAERTQEAQVVDNSEGAGREDEGKRQKKVA